MSDSALQKAVLSLDEGAVAAALAAGGDANETIPGQYRGTRTLLHAVCDGYSPGGYHRQAAIARLLLKAGAKVDAVNSDGQTPLQRALHYAADPVLRVLVNSGADITVKQPGHWAYPVITEAAQAGIGWLVKRCLEAGVSAAEPDGQGGTPLHGAFYQIPIIGGQFSLEVAKMLLDAGAPVNAQNREGQAALHLACRWVRNLAGVTLLLDRGADIRLKVEGGNEPIHFAAEFGRRPLLDLLKSRGADLEAKNRRGFTPLLHTVARHGFSNYGMEPLIDMGADVNATGKKGEAVIALWISKNNRFSEIDHREHARLTKLLSKGTKATGTNSSQTGLLHRLAKGEHHDLFPAAVAAGAPLNTTAKDGFSPLHNAAMHSDPATAAALLKAGADPKVGSTKVRKLRKKAFPKGCTPKQVAEMLGNTRTAALL